MPSWGTISPRRCRGCRRRQRAAFERYESPIELYRPWADGCVRVPADFGREFQVRLGREEARVDVSALPKQPVHEFRVLLASTASPESAFAWCDYRLE